MVADLFAQIVFHVNMGNQSHKDKSLPPWATATYQPIQPMTDEEYCKCYMVAIMRNPPNPTPVTTTHLPAPPTQSQTPQDSTASTSLFPCVRKLQGPGILASII
ncbi:hypothetical protein DSO57_1015662 [Entomophthora muscae]|uniref:Uncharacterized protein n=1 Tax=Entomophthora muscae TaxID=34485 RepID=A0ACC2UEM8_9FUNG|nr:hypothetical protein DSO57_1015662 [Entomophthora muscae]